MGSKSLPMGRRSPETTGGGGEDDEGGNTNLAFWSDEAFVDNVYLKTATPIYPQFKNNNQLFDKFDKFDKPTESTPLKRKTRKSTQILAAFAANMGSFALGSVLSWTSTGLPSLREGKDMSTISGSESSWIGAMATVGAVCACPFAGYGISHFGRRKTMLMLTFPFVFGWMLIYFAKHPNILYVGRFITGFCGGAFTITSPVFIAETAEKKIRGALASGFDLAGSAGMLYIFSIGAFTSWRIQALCCGVLPLVVHLLLMLVPESPRYLVEVRDYKKATRAISWLYGYPAAQVDEELKELVASVNESRSKPVTVRKILFKMSVLKPILVCIGLMFFLAMSGYDAVTFYTVDIFEDAKTSLDPRYSTIILGAIQVVATIPAAYLVEKYGRRPLLMISEVFMSISLFTMGIYFFLKRPNICASCDDGHISWLPLSSLTVFLISYSIGIGPLSMIMVGELLPPHIKGLASCVVLAFRWSIGFVVTKNFEDFEGILGADGCYWLFSLASFVGIFFFYFCMPETKGKNLDEIQRFFVSAQKLQEEERLEALERKAISQSI